VPKISVGERQNTTVEVADGGVTQPSSFYSVLSHQQRPIRGEALVKYLHGRLKLADNAIRWQTAA
jgi:hypothetical protein